MKLQICDPVITSHHFYALPLSIIGSDPKLKPWLYSEFIQMYTCRNREDEKVDIRLYNKDNEMFKYEPLHDAIIAPKRLVYGEQVIDVYKALLNSNQYIYDFIDKYYIYSFGYIDHFIHDLLIYGYDDNDHTFLAYGYVGTKLVEFFIPYNEYIEAYNSEYMQNRHHITILYRKKENDYSLSINKIGMFFNDYINGINTFNRENLLNVCLYKPKFGINIYDELKYMIEYNAEHNLDIDIPNIYCLYDHKKFMNTRIRYLDTQSILKCPRKMIDKFGEIERIGRQLSLLSLKLNQTGLKKEGIVTYMETIERLKKLEEETYTEYYEYNNSVFENV